MASASESGGQPVGEQAGADVDSVDCGFDDLLQLVFSPSPPAAEAADVAFSASPIRQSKLFGKAKLFPKAKANGPLLPLRALRLLLLPLAARLDGGTGLALGQDPDAHCDVAYDSCLDVCASVYNTCSSSGGGSVCAIYDTDCKLDCGEERAGCLKAAESTGEPSGRADCVCRGGYDADAEGYSLEFLPLFEDEADLGTLNTCGRSNDDWFESVNFDPAIANPFVSYRLCEIPHRQRIKFDPPCVRDGYVYKTAVMEVLPSREETCTDWRTKRMPDRTKMRLFKMHKYIDDDEMVADPTCTQALTAEENCYQSSYCPDPACRRVLSRAAYATQAYHDAGTLCLRQEGGRDCLSSWCYRDGAACQARVDNEWESCKTSCLPVQFSKEKGIALLKYGGEAVMWIELRFSQTDPTGVPPATAEIVAPSGNPNTVDEDAPNTVEENASNAVAEGDNSLADKESAAPVGSTVGRAAPILGLLLLLAAS